MIWLSSIGFLVSFIVSAYLIRGMRGRASIYGEEMPQRSHVGHVPRVGGIALLLGMGVAWLLGVWQTLAGDPGALALEAKEIVCWIAVLLPATVGGIAEDFTQRLPVRWRLLLTLASGVLAVWLLNVQVPRLGLPWLDSMWHAVPWVGVGIALLAVTGLPHAINIIDGYNGLSGMVSLVICLALVHVCLQVGDRTLAALLLGLVAATGGFLVWNYPLGLLFAGDGGAYLWGVTIAVVSLVLVQRHADVSPWFPMLLLIYPVCETVFSSYRKWIRGGSPAEADRLHLHQLIYRRVVDAVSYDAASRSVLERNNRTAPYLWGFCVLTVVPAVVFWNNTLVLMTLCGLFSVAYVVIYIAIVRFKVPGWVRS